MAISCDAAVHKDSKTNMTKVLVSAKYRAEVYALDDDGRYGPEPSYIIDLCEPCYNNLIRPRTLTPKKTPKGAIKESTKEV